MGSENEQVALSDIMGSLTAGSNGGDEEILKIASDYALQITPSQISCLLKLKMFGIDNKEKYPNILEKVNHFTQEYLTMKKFHESGAYIMRMVDSLSLKKIVPNDAVKVNVMKQ